MGGQNETGAARAFPEDVGPAILWRLGRLRDDPELGPGRVNERDAVPCGGAAGPTAPQEIDGVIGVDAAARVQRPVAIQQAGIGDRDAGRGAGRPTVRFGRANSRASPNAAWDKALVERRTAIRPCPPAALLNLHWALPLRRRVNADSQIDFLGRSWPIAPTKRDTVTLIHHPLHQFWAVTQPPSPPSNIWPEILGKYSL